MKYILMLFMIFTISYNYSQTQVQAQQQEITINYNDFELYKSKPLGKCITYISRDKIIYQLGDEINVGLPSGNINNFIFIHSLKKDVYVTTEILNKTGIIKSISIIGSKQEGWIIQIRVIINNVIYNIDNIELAIENSEIIK